MINTFRNTYIPSTLVRRTLAVCGVFLALLMGIYAYLMRSLVSEAIAWRSAERAIVEETTRVAGLEQAYIARDISLTRDAGVVLGLFEPQHVVYVTRRTPERVSLLTTHE